MNSKISRDKVPFQSKFSFEPLFRTWKDIIAEGRPGISALYQELLEKANAVPELLKPIDDLDILRRHSDLVEQFFATVFPVTLSDTQDFFAAAVPFKYQTVFSSKLFQRTLLDENGNYVHEPDMEEIHPELHASAFQLILKKYYNFEMTGEVKSIHGYTCPFTGAAKHMEVELDTSFIDVVKIKELPGMPDSCKEACTQISSVIQSPETMEWLTPDAFRFEGFAIVQIRDVTTREIINNIKNTLLNLDSFSDADTFRELQAHIQNLVGVPGVQFGITPFFQINDEIASLELHQSGSILLKEITDEEHRTKISGMLHEFFRTHRRYLFTPSISEKTIEAHPFLEFISRQGWCCSIVWPLFNENKFLGTLEIVTAEPGKLNPAILQQAELAIPLFELALKRIAENLEARLDKIIKEQFTAVQTSVEWRFIKAALGYLSRVQNDEDAKIEPIVFENVYPIYGAIDIRNSSTERNASIQKDMLEQLQLAGEIIKKARKVLKYPLLKETAFKIRKHIHSVSNIILSDDEISINNFFRQEIVQLFTHIQTIEPSLKEDIDGYFEQVNSNVDMLYHNRKMFDESLTRINNTLARFVDREQAEAQKIFPHYFERFVTDGVDFNIYLGQSICPGTEFNEFYLKNIKLWQLTLLAKAARLTKKLESQLELPLQTTQLILANSNPISISFRPAERKFDVDGAYNIRYEIIKKRIDKVHLKDSNERLSQPGTIAIVYSQPKEATEYMQYIEYLQNEGLLKEKVERLELEELQGVIGLKALRVEVSFEELHNKPTQVSEKDSLQKR